MYEPYHIKRKSMKVLFLLLAWVTFPVWLYLYSKGGDDIGN